MILSLLIYHGLNNLEGSTMIPNDFPKSIRIIYTHIDQSITKFEQ